MSPIDWAFLPLKKYADFTGRAPRAEYWWYALLMTLIAIVLTIAESTVELALILGAYTLPNLLFTVATFVPTLAVQVRRLHDINRTGYWAFPFAFFQLATLVGGGFAMQDMESGTIDMSLIVAAGALILVSAIFGLVVVIFSVRAGDKGDNSYGRDPYAGTNPAVA